MDTLEGTHHFCNFDTLGYWPYIWVQILRCGMDTLEDAHRFCNSDTLGCWPYIWVKILRCGMDTLEGTHRSCDFDTLRGGATAASQLWPGLLSIQDCAKNLPRVLGRFFSRFLARMPRKPRTPRTPAKTRPRSQMRQEWVGGGAPPRGVSMELDSSWLL